MKVVCDSSLCTGCGICLVKCPKKCISMEKKGNLGHLYPHINEIDCINCGKCTLICPSINHISSSFPLAAYAGWSKNELDYQTSSSGGAASVLSHHIIKKNGVVYGCAMLPNLEVKHIRVDNLDELPLLKGSKYVQSNIVEVLPLIENDVNKGRLTLFIGTPCQCAAVMSLFKSIPSNLVVVDLICHGVPSFDFLNQCIEKITKHKSYDKISFRNGSVICMTITKDSNIVYQQSLSHPRYKDIYLNTFFDGFSYRESCYSCQYAQSERISDLTIGDFWGLGEIDSCDGMAPHSNGCSLIMPCSSKGDLLLQEVKSSLNLYQRRIEEAVNGNTQLRHPMIKSRRCRIFRKLIELINFPQLYYLVMADKICKYIIKNTLNKCLK